MKDQAIIKSFVISKIHKPGFAFYHFEEEEFRYGVADLDAFIFFTEGFCTITHSSTPEINVKKGEFIFVPYGAPYKGYVPAGTELFIIRMNLFTELHGRYNLRYLYDKIKDREVAELPVLPIRPVVVNYLKGISLFLSNPISKQEFYDIKVQELFLILSEYYTPEELAWLLKPVLNRDFAFADFVFRYCLEVKNVRELVERSTYCEAAFCRKFKVVFGITPHKWLNRRKAGLILQELKGTNKPIKQIAEDYEFNTIQQFSNYCRRNFHKTPGALRKEVK